MLILRLAHIYDRSPIEDYFTDAANEQAKYPPNEMSIEMVCWQATL